MRLPNDEDIVDHAPPFARPSGIRDVASHRRTMGASRKAMDAELFMSINVIKLQFDLYNATYTKVTGYGLNRTR